MFDSVEAKLEAARYFMDLLKSLERESGGILASASPRIVTALLDAFLFEVIAAKDFFLQEVNDAFGSGLPRDKVHEQALLSLDEATLPDRARRQVRKLMGLGSRSNSWLWRLNNYRNAAAHRQIVRRRIVAIMGGPNEIRLFLDADPEDPLGVSTDKEIIQYCEESLRQMEDCLNKLYSGLEV